ncbi:RNA polymerase sigma factor [Agathobaculum sp. Marseille-P7918]|uniref:RNA polymerase sigma factor n=1 Tax=Agathobaculum sp. Marseille-P7918 TaxID=2479843 RepID=UPI0035633542
MNETKLIRALQRGQRGALDKVISHYSSYVASIARNVSGVQTTREDLEEIVSDVFIALWRTAERLDETRPLKSYLAAIARNAAVDRLRRIRPEEPLPEEDILSADEAQGPEAEALKREQAETLRRLLLEMAADDREIFVRFYYYRQTVREIAALLGRNESTVKARLARGRARLRERLIREVDGNAHL